MGNDVIYSPYVTVGGARICIRSKKLMMDDITCMVHPAGLLA